MIQYSPTSFETHLFHEGNLFKAYELFGSHLLRYEGKVVTRFTVWAPNAVQVNLIGSFNNWNSNGFRLIKQNDQGIWSLTIPLDLSGELYKYEIVSKKGVTLLKSDPFAFFSEVRPNTASIVYDIKGYKWNDQKWIKNKENKSIYHEPLFIYELHLGTWKLKDNGEYYSYAELANELIPYIKEHGFTHIEILPLVEHPYDRSWGYQGVSYFSATSRYGTPKDLMYFIDQCHQHNIGVILDWVPGHFCKDAHGLYLFDGEPVYDYPNEKDRENFIWGTANFDLGKNEVQSFLISNALFWIEYFHIDGFRVDAVANIIYWPGEEKIPNRYAIDFLKKMNRVVFQHDPTVLMIAEDSTDWPMVTAPTHVGGIGFNYKWNMGWMNDILKYMEELPEKRTSLHHKVTFSLMYAFSENFVLPFSHDEVVHGKKSLLNKMPGTYEEKFAQLRLLYGYMVGHPGKKLLFMGGEFGQFSEWKDLDQLDWNLFNYDMHRKMDAYIRELLKFYRRSKPLYELDHSLEGFEWIDVNNAAQSIFSFVRKSKEEEDFLLFVCNFKNINYGNYKIGVPKKGEYREVFNSDDERFGGTHHINYKILKTKDGFYHGREQYITMKVPPYGVSILKPVKKRKERKDNGENKVLSDAPSGRKRN